MNTDLLPVDAMKRYHYSPTEIDAMRRFCVEYLHDNDPVNAALRIGITKLYAKSVSDDFMKTDFVQNEIKRLTAHNGGNIVLDKDALKQELVRNLLGILKKDGDSVNQGARIAAAKQLAELMELSPKATNESQQVHNIMIVPPSIESDEWSKLAIASQTDLRAKLGSSS